MRLLLQSRLESVGYHVQTAACGGEALVATAMGQPEPVILDVRLPDVPGYHVARQLRKASMPWSVPILMLTARCDVEDVNKAMSAGADIASSPPRVWSPYDGPRLRRATRPTWVSVFGTI